MRTRLLEKPPAAPLASILAMVWGVGVATNTPPPRTATYGTASAAIDLPGGPHLAAAIAGIQRKYGPVDVIEIFDYSHGSGVALQLQRMGLEARVMVCVPTLMALGAVASSQPPAALPALARAL